MEEELPIMQWGPGVIWRRSGFEEVQDFHTLA